MFLRNSVQEKEKWYVKNCGYNIQEERKMFNTSWVVLRISWSSKAIWPLWNLWPFCWLQWMQQLFTTSKKTTWREGPLKRYIYGGLTFFGTKISKIWNGLSLFPVITRIFRIWWSQAKLTHLTHLPLLRRGTQDMDEKLQYLRSKWKFHHSSYARFFVNWLKWPTDSSQPTRRPNYPFYGKPMVNKPSIRPHFSGGYVRVNSILKPRRFDSSQLFAQDKTQKYHPPPSMFSPWMPGKKSPGVYSTNSYTLED